MKEEMTDFVAVYRTDDPALAEQIVDVLGQAGIEARLVGARHDSIFGLAAALLEQRIDVPAASAEEAARLIDQILAESHAATPDSGPDPDPDPDPDPAIAADDDAPSRRRLSPLLAAGVTPVLPGGAHFYARRPWAGGLIAVGLVVGFWALMAGSSREAHAAIVVIGGLLLFDLVGGQLAVRAFNRGAAAGAARQVLTASVVLFGLGAAGTLLAPTLQRWRIPVRADDASATPGDPGTEEIRQGATHPDNLPFPLRLRLP